MADWYVSSAAYAGVAAFVASHAYNVGDLLKPTAPATGREYVFRCTTAGTSGTEPTWSSAINDGNTITSGGATFTNISGRSTYGWGAAAGTLYCISVQISNRPAVGDRVFVSSDHSETNIGQIYAFGATFGFGLIEFISVNRAGSVPPVAADITSGAAVTFNAYPTLEAYTDVFWQGFTFTLTGTSGLNWFLNGSGTKAHYYKNCTFVISNTNVGTRLIGQDAKVIFDNTTVQFGNAAQYIASVSYPLDLVWINTPSAIQGAIPPTTLIGSGNATGCATCTFRGIDLSALTTTLVAVAQPGGPNKVLFESCKINASVTRYGQSPGTNSCAPMDEVELVNCHDGTNVINERWTTAGSVVTDRGTYLTGGAQDDVGSYSLKLAASTRADKFVFPLDGFAFDVENTALGSLSTYGNWNPSDISGITLSGGNLTATGSGSGGVRGTPSQSSGKFYFEYTISAYGGGTPTIGIASATQTLASSTAGTQQAIINYGGSFGNIYANGANIANIGYAGVGTVYCIAVDIGAQLIWFRQGAAGNWNNSGTANPATGAGGASFSSLTGAVYPFFGSAFGTDAVIANFGAGVFTGAVPSGFFAGWPVTVGVSKTATVEIAALSTLNTDDISLLLEYMGTAGSSLASFHSSLPATLTAGSPIASSAASWSIATTYATWNAADSLNVTFASANLKITSTSSSPGGAARGTAGYSTGKFYWEVTMTQWTSNSWVGIATAGAAHPLSLFTAGSAGVNTTGAISVNGSSSGSSLGSRSNGDVIGIAVDFGAALIWWRVAPSGNWNGSGTANPATGTGGISISALTGPLYPYSSLFTSGDNATANFGAGAFSGAVPSGFAAGLVTSPSVLQKLQATFTPQVAGRVRGLVRLGKASTTAWVNPQITIT
jgi:hypothetical protein